MTPFNSFRFFEDAVTRLMSEPRTGRPWSPAVDILETEDELWSLRPICPTSSSPTSMSMSRTALSIKGERKFEKDFADKGFHRIERNYGSFVRSFSVPNSVDTERVSADYKNGVLTVKLPKKEAAKPKQVKD